MKRGRSTGTPTAEEAARIEAVKMGPCVCCVRHAMNVNGWSLAVAVDSSNIGVEYHHLLSGGIRRGHMFGIGLCEWHHRGRSPEFLELPLMRKLHGPSLAEGSKPFHAAFGSDEELLRFQDQVLDQLQELST